MSTPELQLPLKRNNIEFIEFMEKFYEQYIKLVTCLEMTVLNDEIREVCKSLIKCLNEYFNGKHSCAYDIFSNDVMRRYGKMSYYQKSGIFNPFIDHDPLKLYRVRKLSEEDMMRGERKYDRKEIFHTPFNMREKVSSCRYSIAGYPSLYLGTSIELCLNEANINDRKKTLVSRFKINRNLCDTNVNIKVLDLAIKPSDFLNEKSINYEVCQLKYEDKQKKYLILYPLIAACSVIAENSEAKFVPEYIVPQLLMQWLLRKDEDSTNNQDSLWGIRYYSCRSVESSSKGFNYVFWS